MVPESWLDNIIILKVDTSKLDKSKLFIDQNVQNNEGDTLEYRGTIPWEALSLQTLNEVGEANLLPIDNILPLSHRSRETQFRDLLVIPLL